MPQPTISCLVVSRNATLLTRLLASLVDARRFWQPGDEVLCSWNGSHSHEQAIECQGLPFRIAARSAYHFASNVNELAAQAGGELLAILNDDLILDPGSLDRAIQVLASRPDIGLVGGKLRHHGGRLTHLGIMLNREHMPYNRLRPDRLLDLLPSDELLLQESGPITAVTGALMVMRHSTFRQLQMRTTFRICGEDVAYCLDLQTKLQKLVWFASDVTAIHDEKTTRGEAVDHFDRLAVARLAAELEQSWPQLRAQHLHWYAQEADLLEQIIHRQRKNAHRQAEILNQNKAELAELRQQLEASHQTITSMRNSLRWRLLHPLASLKTLARLYRERRSHHNKASGRKSVGA